MINIYLYSNATAGVIASFFSSFTLCPTELVKCKLQSIREVAVICASNQFSHGFVLDTDNVVAIFFQFQNINNQTLAKHITPFQLTRQIFKQEGILGFYRGLGPTLAREMPGYFFFFGGYEGTREFLRK